jgi:RNA polymerase sigma-70 factor, ECF subfamily
VTIVERGITTENYALAETTVRELRVVLARLSPEQRQVISLRLAGLSSGQICSVMGKSSSWVGATQALAIRRLRDLWHSGLALQDE